MECNGMASRNSYDTVPGKRVSTFKGQTRMQSASQAQKSRKRCLNVLSTQSSFIAHFDIASETVGRGGGTQRLRTRWPVGDGDAMEERNGVPTLCFYPNACLAQWACLCRVPDDLICRPLLADLWDPDHCYNL
jgi:hypothetical protein